MTPAPACGRAWRLPVIRSLLPPTGRYADVADALITLTVTITSSKPRPHLKIRRSWRINEEKRNLQMRRRTNKVHKYLLQIPTFNYK